MIQDVQQPTATLPDLELAVCRAAEAWSRRYPSVPESTRALLAAVWRMEEARSLNLRTPCEGATGR
jgi:hypothetical protein